MIGSRGEESVAEIPRPMFLKPHPGESLRGFIFRLADNECCSLADMQLWLGLSRASARDFSASPRSAQLLGMEVSELNELGVDLPSTSTVAGLEVPSRWIARRTMRICRACFESNSYHRRVWDFNILNVCPEHEIELDETCPSPRCNQKQLWAIPRALGVCSCGAVLSKGEVKKANYGVSSARLLYRRLGLGFSDCFLPRELCDLGARDLVDMMSILGQAEIRFAEPVRRWNANISRSKAFTPAILDAGSELIQGWPDGFYSLCAKFQKSSEDKNGYHAVQYFRKSISGSRKFKYGQILVGAYWDYMELYGNKVGKGHRFNLF